jgi:signal transduction histidine kinase
MWRRFRPPLIVIAAALVVSIALLAGLQYVWLGQISEAERAQRRATLATGAAEFAQDFDREITHAYLLFQADPPTAEAHDEGETAERFATRYDRWQATARFPRVIKEIYTFTQDGKGASDFRRFDAAKRRLEPAEWPASMADWRERFTGLSRNETSPSGDSIFIRRLPPVIWDSVPALVVPMPLVLFDKAATGSGFLFLAKPDLHVTPTLSFSILVLDRDYMSRELLPSLAERYFGHAAAAGTSAGLDFKVAVVSRTVDQPIVFQSPPSFTPAIDAPVDATADFFQVRTQDFSPLAAEVRRFSSFVTTMRSTSAGASGRAGTPLPDRPLSIMIEQSASAAGRGQSASGSVSATTVLPRWKLLVVHPSGSLEAAVSSQRRRNLAISSSILGLLAASMALLVLSTRRAQRLAKQQMEFVAAVSHELRTPLAVIRSAAENLADGVVHDQAGIKRYGELMRNEGRRLTEMVEQILELAGIQSGQRGFALRPVAVGSLLRDIVSSSATLIERAAINVELDLPDDLPPVLGDEPALRRVFQNLVDNAIKYGASGGWIKVSARAAGSQVSVSVADRGIGIEPADQPRIFEPFFRAAAVVAAQMQGAGLGLSLVQRIVAAHGGRVTVKSAPRAGSEFTVQLPAAAKDPIGDAVPAAQSAPDASSTPGGVEAPRYS